MRSTIKYFQLARCVSRVCTQRTLFFFGLALAAYSLMELQLDESDDEFENDLRTALCNSLGVEVRFTCSCLLPDPLHWLLALAS